MMRYRIIQKRKKNDKISRLPKVVQMLVALVVAVVGAAIIKLFLTKILGV